ncbi:hypothetical protein StrepF001_12790 [Streptomyces sp. F001]|nr:hypothetical protein StrepF001_12790 [Streptomyces sp. F001]
MLSCCHAPRMVLAGSSALALYFFISHRRKTKLCAVPSTRWTIMPSPPLSLTVGPGTLRNSTACPGPGAISRVMRYHSHSPV